MSSRPALGPTQTRIKWVPVAVKLTTHLQTVLRWSKRESVHSLSNTSSWLNAQFLKKRPVAWVREWTVPTERPTIVGEVSANFRGYRVQCARRDGSLRPYYRFSRPDPLLFFQVAPQLYSRGWVDPVPDPLLLRKSGSAGNRIRTSGSVARKPSRY
jgi:hypothetical protein